MDFLYFNKYYLIKYFYIFLITIFFLPLEVFIYLFWHRRLKLFFFQFEIIFPQASPFTTCLEYKLPFKTLMLYKTLVLYNLLYYKNTQKTKKITDPQNFERYLKYILKIMFFHHMGLGGQLFTVHGHVIAKLMTTWPCLWTYIIIAQPILHATQTPPVYSSFC